MGTIIYYQESFDKYIKKYNYPKAEKMAIWGLKEKENWSNTSLNPFMFWMNFWFELWGLK